ncbi:IS3 family transposase, partial [Actinomyces bowdenii]|nr:IS3 family transposase [Actinomyces bowdenii]NYS70532.1 IS3 family transposase [Actinomyces bowdenii]
MRAQGFNQALGSRKTWRLLNAQQGHDPVARCTVERRMRALGISGIGPGRKIRTTRPAACAAMPPDLLGRDSRPRRPRPALGGGLHLRPHLVGVLLHRIRHGPVLPPHRGLVDQHH